MYVIQQLINGLSQGSIYALMAIGYTLIVGVVGLITFAYGEMVMIGAMSASGSFLELGSQYRCQL